jgi:hypothetical protein
VVEELSQAADRSTSGSLRTIAPEVLLQTGSAGFARGVAFRNSQSRQSARLTFQTTVLLAYESWARRSSEWRDEIDAFCC